MQFTTDAYRSLPTDAIGTTYFVLGYHAGNNDLGSEASIVATANDTVVTITPSQDLPGHPAGTPYDVTLNLGDVYQINSGLTMDVDGTTVMATKPVSVFGGNECTNVPADFDFCDHLVEQLPPTTQWGRQFVTEPLAARSGGDTFRVLAVLDDTTVTINGFVEATLNRGEMFEGIIQGASTIDTNHPVLVAQYSNGTLYDGVTSDPFMMLIPPYEQFLNNYVVTTPASGFAMNFINVVAPTSEIGQITLDGAVVGSGAFAPIGTSGFSGAELAVDLGSHALSGPQPFGIFVYGFSDFDSYGYPGGYGTAQVATATHIAVDPGSDTVATGTNACVTATVTTDTGLPVIDARVDFTVTGVNSKTGFAETELTARPSSAIRARRSGETTSLPP